MIFLVGSSHKFLNFHQSIRRSTNRSQCSCLLMRLFPVTLPIRNALYLHWTCVCWVFVTNHSTRRPSRLEKKDMQGGEQKTQRGHSNETWNLSTWCKMEANKCFMIKKRQRGRWIQRLTILDWSLPTGARSVLLRSDPGGSLSSGAISWVWKVELENKTSNLSLASWMLMNGDSMHALASA